MRYTMKVMAATTTKAALLAPAIQATLLFAKVVGGDMEPSVAFAMLVEVIKYLVLEIQLYSTAITVTTYLDVYIVAPEDVDAEAALLVTDVVTAAT
jgi:hypothetical protein